MFASQFLAGAVRRDGDAGVFVTCEERPQDLRRNMAGFGWDIAAWEGEGRWAFVDASPEPGVEALEVGAYDLGAFLARIEAAVKRVGASRVALDSVGALFGRFRDETAVRRALLRIAARLREMEVTAVATAEQVEEGGAVARHGVEEFVADNVVILRNRLERDRRQRTVEILKYRGTDHHKGEYPFTVVSGEGIAVIPLSALSLQHGASSERIPSGNPELDRMCGGGLLKGSSILVSGATGTGKTLLAAGFVAGGAGASERCLIFAFEESPAQLRRNAAGWGFDLQRMEEEGLLKVVCRYPESSGLEDHLIAIRSAIEEFEPDRVAVDSLSALERIAPERIFREFVIGLTSHIKERELTALYTATTPTLVGGASVSEAHVSTITDSIVVLRYVEVSGSIRRGVAVLKMRGSDHDRQIREFTIGPSGMEVGEAFGHATGLLEGAPRLRAGGIDSDAGAS